MSGAPPVLAADVAAAEMPAGVITYSHDANGNTIGKSGEATYIFDAQDRLRRVEKLNGTVIEHLYDGDGNRVRTTTTRPGQTPHVRNFLIDPTSSLPRVVAETDGNGDAVAFYVWGGAELLEIIRPDGSDGYTRKAVHTDGVGSVRALTDESGQVTDRYEFTGFGELVAQQGSDPQPFAFAGEPLDRETGLQYHRARWMDPRIGRFVGMDPYGGSLKQPASLHRYSYADGDPANLIDPSGLFFESASALTALSASNTIAAVSPLNAQLMSVAPPVLNVQPLELRDFGRRGLTRPFAGWSEARDTADQNVVNGHGIEFQLGAAATIWGKYGVALNILPKKGPTDAPDTVIPKNPTGLYGAVRWGGLQNWSRNTIPVVFAQAVDDISSGIDGFAPVGADIPAAVVLSITAAPRYEALAHEIGHTLGLPQELSAGTMMYERGGSTLLTFEQMRLAQEGARKRAGRR